MIRTGNPRACDAGANGSHEKDQAAPDFRSFSDEWKVFWLHVSPVGETRFDHEPPNLPSLRVAVLDDADGRFWEETRTVNHKETCGCFSTIKPVWPRGEGWALFDAESDNCTTWRRLAVRS
jgi:hypothetical protein